MSLTKEFFMSLNTTPNEDLQERINAMNQEFARAFIDAECRDALEGVVEYEDGAICVYGKNYNFFWIVETDRIADELGIDLEVIWRVPDGTPEGREIIEYADAIELLKMEDYRAWAKDNFDKYEYESI
jgi:hypothetical protein